MKGSARQRVVRPFVISYQKIADETSTNFGPFPENLYPRKLPTIFNVIISSSIFLTSRKPLGWPRNSLIYCHYGSRRTWKRTSDYFESTDSLLIFSTVFFIRALNVFIYISGVCVCGVFVAMVTSVLHPHCICSLISAIKSVINHIVLCVQHHYVPSYIKYIVMHCCYGEICVQQHWFQALLHGKRN